MTEPVCAQKSPFVVEIEPGDYSWCACGRSQKQPFCDGSHKGTGIEPLRFTITQKEKKWLCGCKRTRSAPFCDGTHKSI